MKRIDYSRHAARACLILVLPVLGGALLGKAVSGSGRGAGIGAGAGCGISALLAYRTYRRRRRGNDWVSAARSAGLKAIYSGHAPTIALEGFRWLDNLAGGSEENVRLVVGDRLEWYADYHTDGAIGTVETNSLQTVNSCLEETFFALWVPALAHEAFALGRRKSLFTSDATVPPDGIWGTVLREWIQAHPGWRLEGYDDLVVGTRPNRVVSPEELGEFIGSARELARALQSAG